MGDTIFGNNSYTPATDSGGVTTRAIGNEFQIQNAGRCSQRSRYWWPAAGLGALTQFQIWDMDNSVKLLEVDLSTISGATNGQWNYFGHPTVNYDFVAPHNYWVGVRIDGASIEQFLGGQTLPMGNGQTSPPTGTIRMIQAMYGENRTANQPPNQVFPGGIYFSDTEVVALPGTQPIRPRMAVQQASRW